MQRPMCLSVSFLASSIVNLIEDDLLGKTAIDQGVDVADSIVGVEGDGSHRLLVGEQSEGRHCVVIVAIVSNDLCK